MASFYMSLPKYIAPATHDKHGRLLCTQYFHRLNNEWCGIYRKYTERGDPPGILELPKNARPSRKRLYAKLNRYRHRVNKTLP